MYERVGEEIKRRVRFLVIRRTLLMAVLVIAAVAAVGSNNEDLVAPAIIAGLIVIIWVYSSARLQYLLLYGYGELIDKVSDLEARSQGGKKGGRKPQRPAESHTEPNAEPEPEPDCSDEGQPKTKRRPDGSWKCMFCDHMNPSGKDYCQKCGAEAFFDQP